ncbi:aspartokinase [Clostridia bacterium]|nr:aspartokinase [Clostridia bacterium]
MIKMALIVQKYGGSSVADADCIRRVAKRVTDTYRAGNQVVVVLSAQGDTTDDLIEKAAELNPSPSKREMDMLLACGEQMSIALCAMAIEALGCPVVSLTGWQIGMKTDSNYGGARIRRVDGQRVAAELDRKNIVLVAGFQGINRNDDITTLGRGGSDTTAVAIAAALKADLCQIFTDVDGVYTADPRLVKTAKKLDEITYDEMLELASLGAQVLHNRSVEMAKRYHVELEVLSSFTNAAGTKVKEVVNMEDMQVSGVARDLNVARVSLTHLPDSPGVAFRLFSLLSQRKINVDIILQSIGRGDTKDISFTVARTSSAETAEVIRAHRDMLGYDELLISEDVAKLSIVGSGMVNNPGVAARMFEALYKAGVNIQMISTSEIKVSVLIKEKDSERAVQAVHEQFFGA